MPKEPNDLVQLDFWGPVKYVRGRKKYVFVPVDTFSHWPSAYFCSSNKSKNVLKFLRKYINTHGHPRKLHMLLAHATCTFRLLVFSQMKFKVSVTTKVSNLLNLRLGIIARQEWLNELLGR